MSMKCIYCEKLVFGSGGMTVPKCGPAHQQCYQAHQALRRTFQSLDISRLNDQELFELKELIKLEENFRKRQQQNNKTQNDIELF